METEVKVEVKPEPTVKELLNEIRRGQQGLEAEKKVKSWRVPWKARVSGKRAQKGWATIQIIHDNGDQDFIKAPIKDGLVDVEGFPRIATAQYKVSYKGKPWYIIPAWSMN